MTDQYGNWKLWTFSLLLMPLLLGLSLWQLRRAGEKEALLKAWAGGQIVSADSLGPGAHPPFGQPVSAVGRFDSHFQWLLDNRTRDGQPGYEVLDLLRLRNGLGVLVNRGWIPAPALRTQLPSFSTPQGPVHIRARVADYPQPPVLRKTAPEAGWPRRVQSLRPQQLRVPGLKVLPFLLRLASAGQQGAFRVDWPVLQVSPARHYGYAAQWFAMAVVLAILTVRAGRRRRERHDNQSGQDSVRA